MGVISFATDQPITDASQDRFGRREFAARIAKVISSLEDANSVVISVNGPWGEGKTSLLNMIAEELALAGNAVLVHFNPWRFQDEDRLLRNFFNTLAERLKVDLKKVSEKIGEGFKDIVKCLSVFQVAGVSTSGTKDIVDKLFPDADLEEVKRRISTALSDSEKKIVIFMDDIDRLDKRDVQAVFRLVKLTADFPNTTYVLAFDDEIVTAAIAEQFGGHDAGRSFLEKIVQIPLPVPPASPHVLREMAFEGVESALRLADVELTRPEVRLFVTLFDRTFSHMLSSPRAVKRYTNMLNFAIPILKDEANMLDLIFVEGVRAFFPKLYGTIRAESDLFLRDSLELRLSPDKQEGKDRFEEILKWAMEGLSAKEAEGALLIVRQLFPGVRSYGVIDTLAGKYDFNGAGYYEFSEDERREDRKRICASEYFRRYFNYGIPPKDVSDREVDLFVASLAEADSETIMTRIGALSEGHRSDTLIRKLNIVTDKVSSRCASKLAIAVARRSELIPLSHPSENFFGVGSLAQAAYLIRRLLRRIDDTAQRDETARDVAEGIASLPFGYEFCDVVRKLKKEEGSCEFVTLVSDECELEIGRIFAEKLATAAETQPLEDSYPLWKQGFYFHWGRNNQRSLQQYVQRRLRGNPRDVAKILNAILGISDDEKPGFFEFADPDAKYRFLTQIIDADEMMDVIRRCYGETGTAESPPAVRWFVSMYEQGALGNASQ